MNTFQKIAAISALVLILLIAGWAYACSASVPWLSDFARSTTHDAASALGMHVFEAPSSGTAKKLTVADLPTGYYLFAGSRFAQSAPKWVIVMPGGGISWLDNLGETKAPPASQKPVSTQMKPTDGQIESYNYPVIKFAAKQMPGADGAIGQLSTTFVRGEAGKEGTVKYRLTLFKSANNSPREVQLLDGDGFKMHQFTASGFHDIPGSQLMEARDDFPLDEANYLQWRDTSIR